MNIVRRPLTWLVAGEILLVAALAFAAWHVHQARSAAQAPPAADVLAPRERPELSPIAPGVRPTIGLLASPQPSPTGPRPALATDAGFLAGQARAINRDQAAWEGVQWELVRAAMQAGRDYIDKVVLPAVLQAERKRDG
jgi:hypothetical protein